MTLFWVGLLLVLTGGGVSLLGSRFPRFADRAFALLVVAGCAAVVFAAAAVLIDGSTAATRFASTLPGGVWLFAIDPLSAFILVAILVAGGASAVFGTGYLSRLEGNASSSSSVSCSHVLLSVELVALALVVTAQAVMPFLCAWEVMAVTAYLLIVFDHEHADVRRAGLLYIVAAHLGILALMAMFATWGAGNSVWTFDALARSGPLTGGRSAAVLALALLGFGLKAGMVPFHFWLPSAHAAAPTHVSAILSGVVLKTGVYGLLRVIVLLGGTPPTWWGWLVLGFGLLSGVLGVVWALAQHDIKRLLAYHSVENIGIILLGIGIGALGAAYHHPAIAVLGIAGAVLHTLNHALFKSLLFFAAGVVYRLTGTRDIELLGGLAKRLPFTWLAFALGSVAIIGVPPLNGFISEWTIYQAFFHAGGSTATLRLAVVGAIGLALIGGLALACFAKVGGVVFLGRARDDRELSGSEVRGALLIPMGALAVACLLIGVLPSLVVGPAIRVGAFVLSKPDALRDVAVQQVAGDAWIVGALSLGVIVFVAFLGWRVRVRLRGRVTIGETWACGYTDVTPRLQYSASSLAAPLLDTFGAWSGTRVVRGARELKTIPLDLVLDRVVAPAWQRIRAAGARLRPIQQGRLHLYVLYIIATLVGLLVYLAASVPG